MSNHKRTWNQRIQTTEIRLPTRPTLLCRSGYVKAMQAGIHNNPVEAGVVREAHEYNYSSAVDYSGGKGLLDVDFL